MTATRLAAVCLAAATAACAHAAPSGRARFANQLPITRVNDRLDTPTKPRERAFPFLMYVFDSLVVDAATNALKFPERRRAMNVNSMDEAPDSTWFTNRIGTRPLSVEAVRVGPNRPDGPGQHLPWTIVSSKVGGNAVGFIIKDSRGQKHLLKFDFQGAPEMETGAHVIVQRILWACGYNVPEDDIVYFERDQLVLGQNAVIKDVFGNKRRMSQHFVDDQLSRIIAEPGKPIRGLLSRYIDGIPIGGFSGAGMRGDDPNDTVPHQHRRELRGLQPIASWLGHTDFKEGNTLDAWTPDPSNPDHHYLVHYMIDFGKSLGTMAVSQSWSGYSFAYALDWPWVFRSTVSLGLWPRPWDGIRTSGYPRGVGLFESDKYRPGEFRTNLPYPAFEAMDRFDGFWGAKLLIRFSRAQLRAIVEQAKFTDPRATEYMIETLVARQRRTARYWFHRVAPVDNVRVEHTANRAALCFDDLLLAYYLEDTPWTASYRVRTYGHDGRQLADRGVIGGARTVCVSDIAPGPTHEGYVIVRFDRRSKRRTWPPVYVHLARDSAGTVAVIGLWRH